jgi:hypothetical protein
MLQFVLNKQLKLLMDFVLHTRGTMRSETAVAIFRKSMFTGCQNLSGGLMVPM